MLNRESKLSVISNTRCRPARRERRAARARGRQKGKERARVDRQQALSGASAPNFDLGGGSHRSHTDNI